MNKLFGILRVEYLLVLLVIYLILKTYKKRKESHHHLTFFRLLLVGLIQTISIFLMNLNSESLLFFSPEVNFIITLLYFTAFALTAYGWFSYNEITMNSQWIRRIRNKLLLAIPIIIYFILCASSYWTHLLFYYDYFGTFQRGPLAVLQFAIPSLYAQVMVIRLIIRIVNNKKKDPFIVGILFFPIAHIIGIILQVNFGYDHVAIASVSSLLVAYLELFSVEAYQLEKTQAIAEEMRKQYRLIEALSSDFSDVFMLDFKVGSSTSFKIRGKILPEHERKVNRYNHSCKYYVENYVLPDDRDRVWNNLDIDVVRRSLRNSPSYGFTYRAIVEDKVCHYQIKFYLIENKTKNEEKIIFAFRCVDDIINV